MKILSPKTSLWAPAAASAGISLVIVAESLAGLKPGDGFGLVAPLVYFLPVIFLLGAQVTSRYIGRLEERIAGLEQRLEEKSD